MTSRTIKRVWWVLLALIVIGGGALRFQNAARVPAFRAGDYWDLARSLHEDNVLGFSWEDGKPSARRGILYPSFIALVDSFDSPGRLRFARAQALLSTLTIALAGLLGLFISGPLAGLAAAAFVGFHPTLIRSVPDPNIELFYGFLVLAVGFASVLWAAKPGDRTAGLLGFFTGVSLMCRSVLFLFLPVLLAAFWARKKFHIGRRSHGAMMLAAAFVLLLPWIARNAYQFRSFTPFESKVVEKNLLTAAAGNLQYTLEDYTNLVEKTHCAAATKDRVECVVDAALEIISAHPGRFFLSSLARLKWAVGLHGWIWLMALFALAANRNDTKTYALGVLCAYFLAVHAPFALVPRYFDPLLPCLLVLAGCAAAKALEKTFGKWWPKIREGAWDFSRDRLMRPSFLCFTGLVVLFYCMGLFHLAAEATVSGWSLSRASLRRGLVLWRSGEAQRAVGEIDRSIKLRPGTVSQGALLLQEEKDFEAALFLLDRLVISYPGESHYLVDRGIVKYLFKREAAGARDFELALRLFPDDPRVRRHQSFASQ